MHACGHDGHRHAAGGSILSPASRNFDGTVYLIFQPAGKAAVVAREMIKGRLFARFPVDAVFGIAQLARQPYGTFAVGAGPVMAINNEFKIVLKGKGGGRRTTLDPIPAILPAGWGFSNHHQPQQSPSTPV